MSVPTLRWRAAIEGMVPTAGLPDWVYRGQAFPAPVWFEGLVFQESSGEPRARRYEPHQDRVSRRDAPADPDVADMDDGELEDDASYGLCQIMGYTARSLLGIDTCRMHGGRLVPTSPVQGGVWPPMRFGWLFRPLTNLSLGIRLLHEELRVVKAEVARGIIDPGQDIERALCRYNGGPTGDDLTGGDLRLRAYVDRIAVRAAAVLADRDLEGPVHVSFESKEEP